MFAHGWLNGSAGSGSMAGMSLGLPTAAPAAPQGKFLVKIRDGSGQVIATQQFNTFDEAKQFVEDFAKAQSSRSAVHETPVAPVSDKF